MGWGGEGGGEGRGGGGQYFRNVLSKCPKHLSILLEAIFFKNYSELISYNTYLFTAEETF